MTELIVKIIFGGSLLGMSAILVRKIPLLKETPAIEVKTIEKQSFILRLTTWVKGLAAFSSNLFLQKIFSKIRILTIRVEKKAEEKLQILREEAKKRVERKNDNYWEKLKKAKDEKNKKSSA